MSAIRLQRYLSQAGVAARRKAEELIVQGAVAVNGKVVTKLGSKVVPGEDRITVDGKAVYPQELFYAILNKPKGCITAVSDPEGRATVMEYLHKLPVAVAPVGRLDFYSEGVLLLTNDGELSARLQSPRRHVQKTYHVKVRDRVSDKHVQMLRDGVELDDGTVTRPAEVDRLRSKSRHEWLVVTLTEGKSRQIHRMLGALDHVVLKIQRVAYGGITFHGLRVGDARELTQVEVNELRAMVKLPRSTVSRGKWSSRREETELGRRARARARKQAEAEVEADFRPESRPGARHGEKKSGPRQGPRSGSRRATPSRRDKDRAGQGSRGQAAGGRRGRSKAGPSARGKKSASSSRSASTSGSRTPSRPSARAGSGTSSRSKQGSRSRSGAAPGERGKRSSAPKSKGATRSSGSRSRDARPASSRTGPGRGKSSKR